MAGFTYQWVQTDSAGDPCAPTCAVANVTLTPVSRTPRSATFTAPAFTVAGATLFFRLTVTDGFGATVQSANLTVALDQHEPDGAGADHDADRHRRLGRQPHDDLRRSRSRSTRLGAVDRRGRSAH